MKFNRRDAKLTQSKALPGSATTVYSDPIDLGHNASGDVLFDGEFLITAPACLVGQLANTETLNYSLQSAVDLAFSSPVPLSGNVITQTGAGGAGAAGATKRVRPPSDCNRYVRLAITKTGSTDASSKSATLELLL